MADETHNKVLAIVANISKTQDQLEKSESNEEDGSEQETTSSKNKIEPIRGIPKSGKFWKSKKER